MLCLRCVYKLLKLNQFFVEKKKSFQTQMINPSRVFFAPHVLKSCVNLVIEENDKKKKIKLKVTFKTENVIKYRTALSAT